MSSFRTVPGCALLVIINLASTAGCWSVSRQSEVSRQDSERSSAVSTGQVRASDSQPVSPSIARVAHEEPVAGNGALLTDADDPFATQSELSLTQLVAEVQRRNPSLQAARAAWGVAAERYRQVVAVDDSILQSPRTLTSRPSSSSVQPSYHVRVAQRVPWFGKRALRGEIARLQADAAWWDLQDQRLRVAETTRVAFVDYSLVHRELELNIANIEAVWGIRATALAEFESRRVTQADVSQADVEIARLECRRIELEQNECVARARINTLLHRVPDHPLPSPSTAVPADGDLPAVENCCQLARDQRPDMRAQAARIRAEQAAVALATKKFSSDLDFVGQHEQVKKLQAEYDLQVDTIRNDVQSAIARLEASRQTVRLYAEKILPASRANVAAAEAGYVAGSVDFLRLVKAKRQLIELQDRHQEAIAEYHRRLAELERVIGAPIPEASTPATGTEVPVNE